MRSAKLEQGSVKKFDRRTYKNLSSIITDFRVVMIKRNQMKALMNAETIDAAFRERLMLAVTAVNKCRYCSYAHAKQALTAGIDEDEIEDLKFGITEKCPVNEIPALLYAQHWAESAGKPEPEARARIVEVYPDETVNAIELTLQTIQMGNLLGNTLDYILFRLSFGKLGA